VDRLIALVLLRFKIEMRGYLRARERGIGVALGLPFLLLLSGAGALIAYTAVSALVRADAGAAASVLSAVATAFGVFWVLSPLLTGMALAENHDVSRLVHFPIPLSVLAGSSLLANVLQPMVLAEIPIALAIAAALGRGPVTALFAALGTLSTVAFFLAASQAGGLVLHALTRNRRLHDAALFAALGLGFATSLLPVLVLSGNLRPLTGTLARAVRADVFAVSPFAWGARAAVYMGRGETVHGLAWLALQALAMAAALGVSAALIGRIHRGELKLGPRAFDRGAPAARMRLPGSVGALLEKDLRVAWRDPALKASLFMGLVGPLVFFLLISQTGVLARTGNGLLMLSAYVGMTAFGSNAFGVERRGVALLLAFPLARWRVLLGKNLGGMIFRLPALLALTIAGSAVAPLFVPAAVTIALAAMMIAAGADNYVSILFPSAAPAAGQSPYAGGGASGRGLGAAFLTAGLYAGAFVLALPFIGLAVMPVWWGDVSWWWVSLPLALGGAAASYALLLGGAEALLLRREPELLERILGEA
jgi:ABC-2 type transport system permease protein